MILSDQHERADDRFAADAVLRYSDLDALGLVTNEGFNPRREPPPPFCWRLLRGDLALWHKYEHRQRKADDHSDSRSSE